MRDKTLDELATELANVIRYNPEFLEEERFEDLKLACWCRLNEARGGVTKTVVKEPVVPVSDYSDVLAGQIDLSNRIVN